MKSPSRDQEDSNVEREVQLVEFTDLNKVSAKLKWEMEFLEQELHKRNEEIIKLKDQKEELIKLNIVHPPRRR